MIQQLSVTQKVSEEVVVPANKFKIDKLERYYMTTSLANTPPPTGTVKVVFSINCKDKQNNSESDSATLLVTTSFKHNNQLNVYPKKAPPFTEVNVRYQTDIGNYYLQQGYNKKIFCNKMVNYKCSVNSCQPAGITKVLVTDKTSFYSECTLMENPSGGPVMSAEASLCLLPWMDIQIENPSTSSATIKFFTDADIKNCTASFQLDSNFPSGGGYESLKTTQGPVKPFMSSTHHNPQPLQEYKVWAKCSNACGYFTVEKQVKLNEVYPDGECCKVNKDYKVTSDPGCNNPLLNKGNPLDAGKTEYLYGSERCKQIWKGTGCKWNPQNDSSCLPYSSTSPAPVNKKIKQTIQNLKEQNQNNR